MRQALGLFRGKNNDESIRLLPRTPATAVGYGSTSQASTPLNEINPDQRIIALFCYCIFLMTFKSNIINTPTLTDLLNKHSDLGDTLEEHLQHDPKFTRLKQELKFPNKNITEAGFKLNEDEYLNEIVDAIRAALESFNLSNSCSNG